jgi:hypothetical protein
MIASFQRKPLGENDAAIGLNQTAESQDVRSCRQAEIQRPGIRQAEIAKTRRTDGE